MLVAYMGSAPFGRQVFCMKASNGDSILARSAGTRFLWVTSQQLTVESFSTCDSCEVSELYGRCAHVPNVMYSLFFCP